MSARDLRRFDPLDEEILRDPYPWYRALRDEAPCHFVEKRNVFVVSRYDDVVAVARNHAVFSSTGGVGYEWEQQPMMPMYDPPEHSRMRRLVSKHFTPAAINTLGESIRKRVAALMQPLFRAGRCELVHDIAIPLSLHVIADLYGMPAKRREDLRRWSQGVVEDLAGGLDQEALARVGLLKKEFVDFLRTTIAERRADPGASPDVLSRILAAEEDDKLSDREVLAFGVLLLVAGFETTVNAIANGVLALIEHPEQWDKVAADASLVPSLCEESVRYDGPVQSFFRNTLAEASVAGVTIPPKVKVQILFASANRDERHFRDPDSFHVDRLDSDHIGYGVGVHYCLGAPLARLQLNAFFEALREKTRSIHLDGAAVRSHSVLFRGVKSLPIAIEQR